MTTKKKNTGANKDAPWNTKNPKPKKAGSALSPEWKAQAKERAAAAGRPYPNLIDNMWAAKQSRK